MAPGVKICCDSCKKFVFSVQFVQDLSSSNGNRRRLANSCPDRQELGALEQSPLCGTCSLLGKVFDSVDAEWNNFSIFCENRRDIEKHNDLFELGKVQFKLSINKRANMRLDHLQIRNGLKQSLDVNHEPNKYHILIAHHHDISVDWRRHHMITPVKNQDICGSCWAFAAVGAIEALHKRQTNQLVSLSEQNLIDCSGEYGSDGCGGGVMSQGYQYVRENGINSEWAYPYEGKNEKCRLDASNIAANVSGFVNIPSGNETSLQNAVAFIGPVSAGIDASHSSFMYYSGGVYYEPKCSCNFLNHAVLVVGYNSTADGQDFWILKNSFGDNWGERGFMRLARNKKNHCGIATMASYPR